VNWTSGSISEKRVPVKRVIPASDLGEHFDVSAIHMFRSHFTTVGLIPALIVLFLAGCGSSTDLANAPDGHTDVKSGVAHAPGSKNPLSNCVECHGAMLEGGSTGAPSCYICHGPKW